PSWPGRKRASPSGGRCRNGSRSRSARWARSCPRRSTPTARSGAGPSVRAADAATARPSPRPEAGTHLLDDHRAIPHRGGHALGRPGTEVADGEDPMQTGLVREATGVAVDVTTGEHVTPVVVRDGVTEPVRPGLGPDEDEQRVGAHDLFAPGRVRTQD